MILVFSRQEGFGEKGPSGGAETLTRVCSAGTQETAFITVNNYIICLETLQSPIYKSQCIRNRPGLREQQHKGGPRRRRLEVCLGGDLCSALIRAEARLEHSDSLNWKMEACYRSAQLVGLKVGVLQPWLSPG